MSTKNSANGLIAELLFGARAIELGYTVLWPGNADCAYDLVLHKGNRSIRVQVKSTIQTKYSSIKTTHKTGHKQKKHSRYTAKEVDILVAYFFSTKTWYLIPVKSWRFRCLTERKEKWAKYKENWSILKGEENE